MDTLLLLQKCCNFIKPYNVRELIKTENKIIGSAEENQNNAKLGREEFQIRSEDGGFH